MPAMSNLLSTITQLSNFQNRRYNSTHGVAASNWLFNHWQSLNPGNRRTIRVRQIPHTWAQPSVEFEILGTGNSGETVVIGAHLDSIAGSGIETSRAPGADDAPKRPWTPRPERDSRPPRRDGFNKPRGPRSF